MPVSAALQVHLTRLAARLDAKGLPSVDDGACSSCSDAPVLVHRAHTPGARYCSCSLCGTLGNYVRSRCTLCGRPARFCFRIEGRTCNDCHDCPGYMKALNHQKDDRLDPVIDDVATLGLDLLVRELGFHRGGVNPFLIGYIGRPIWLQGFPPPGEFRPSMRF